MLVRFTGIAHKEWFGKMWRNRRRQSTGRMYVSSLYLFSVTAANGNSPQPVFNDCLSAFLFCYCPSPPPIFDYFQQQRVRVRTHVQGTGWLVWEIPGHDQSESSFQKDIAPPSVKMLKLRVKHPLKLLNQS